MSQARENEITPQWWRRKILEGLPLALILTLMPLLTRPLNVPLLIATPLITMAIWLASQNFYAWLARRRQRRADDEAAG